MDRIEKVRGSRLASTRAATRALAQTPFLFAEIRQPQCAYVAIPEVSSENRYYIPMAIVEPDVVPLNKLYVIDGGDSYHFGVLMSAMHMGWMRAVAGRLESRYQYSASIVYNNYPWPEPTDAQHKKVEALAQGVLDARANHPTSTLADLYHPTTMPPDLRKAHDALDKAVDQCYRKEPFTSERERVEYLFGLYRKLTEGFGAEEKNSKRTRRQRCD